MLAAALARYQPVWLEQIRLGAPLWVGPTGDVGLLFDGRWNDESIFVQLIAKLDEAGTHKEADYMTMGAMSRA